MHLPGAGIVLAKGFSRGLFDRREIVPIFRFTDASFRTFGVTTAGRLCVYSSRMSYAHRSLPVLMCVRAQSPIPVWWYAPYVCCVALSRSLDGVLREM